MERDIAELDFAKGGGILPVIVQDARSKKVLMLAYMNVDAWRRTVDTGRAWFYSRSRKALWMKGEESGHVQQVKDMSVDCDGDTLLLRVEQEGGAACHEGYETCFYRRRTDSGWEAVEPRRFDPATVYRR